MNNRSLDDWVSEQQQEWSSKPLYRDRREMVALFSEPAVFNSGNEPPALAALRRVFHKQETTSDCSLTSITIILQALLGSGGPANKEAVLDVVDKMPADRRHEGEWRKATVEDGPGVTFADLVRHAKTAFGHYGFSITSVQPDGSDSSQKEIRRYLRTLCPGLCQFSPGSALLLYADQGVFWGRDESYLHVTPVGAYDPISDRVLVVEVDPDTPSLYLSPVGSLMDSLLRTEKTESALRGERGGYVWITPEPGRSGASEPTR